MILSRASEYGIQALTCLCSQPPGTFVSVRQIAADRGISPSFLAKVLNQLVDHGLLVSQKGPGGGVRLGRPPGKITLLQIVAAIDGLDLLTACVAGFPECNDRIPCPLHSQWGPLRERIARMLSERSLEDLMRDVRLRSMPRRSRLKNTRVRRTRAKALAG